MIVATVLLIILLVLIAIVGILLIAPIKLLIDTDLNIYQLQWAGLAKANLIVLPNDLLIKIKFLIWRKKYSVIEQIAISSQSKEKSTKSKTKHTEKVGNRKRLNRKNFRRIFRVLRSFSVRDFRLNLDTGDYIYNSWLYPVFYFLDGPRRHISINYNGMFQARIKVQNRLYKMLLAVLF